MDGMSWHMLGYVMAYALVYRSQGEKRSLEAGHGMKNNEINYLSSLIAFSVCLLSLSLLGAIWTPGYSKVPQIKFHEQRTAT